MDIRKDLVMESAENELLRQYEYIEKAKTYVEQLAVSLGRKPTCCVTTFGCQMNVAPVTA